MSAITAARAGTAGRWEITRQALRPARPISPYYLVLGNEPLAHGLRLAGAVSVLAAAAAITAAASILFARRDLR